MIFKNLPIWLEYHRFHAKPKALPMSPMSAVIAQILHNEAAEKGNRPSGEILTLQLGIEEIILVVNNKGPNLIE